MYLLLLCSLLLPIFVPDNPVSYFISSLKPDIRGARDVRDACQQFLDTDHHKIGDILNLLKSKQKNIRWEMLKLMWV